MADLRFHVGDHVTLRDGARGIIRALAGFNGPDWWEVEPVDTFNLVPDGVTHGSRVKISQTFARDSTLAPCADASPPKCAIGEYYAVAPCGLVYGPPMNMDEAKTLVMRRRAHPDEMGWRIVKEEVLAETLAAIDADMDAQYRARMSVQSAEVH